MRSLRNNGAADASPGSPVSKAYRQPAKLVEGWSKRFSHLYRFQCPFRMLGQGVARHRLISLVTTRYILLLGGLAQLGERLLCKQEVSGSSPLISTNTGR